MGLSILLAEQIAAMFLTMAVGYAIVKIGLFRSEDSKVISNMVVYICSPCIIVDAFQIELTQDKLMGLALSIVMAAVVHGMMIGGMKLLEKPLHVNSIEKASVIYTNSGYLVVPLVASVLGNEWVFYTTGYTIIQTILLWTHGIGVISRRRERDYKKIFLNPNIIAIGIGTLLFITELRLPTVIGSCVRGFGDMVASASMLVIGMVIGNVDLLWVFRQKRPYLICFLRLIAFPAAAVLIFIIVGRMGIHPDAEYILLIVLLAAVAPAATMVTQVAQIYDMDSRYASVINVMSVIFCIITMPLMALCFEMFL